MQLDPIDRFIENYISLLAANSYAQREVWKHNPCDEWLEEMIVEWDAMEDQLKGFSIKSEEIKSLVKEVENFLPHLYGIEESVPCNIRDQNSYVPQYIGLIQSHQLWGNIVQHAKKIVRVFGNSTYLGSI